MGLRVYSVKVYLNKMVITVTIGVGRLSDIIITRTDRRKYRGGNRNRGIKL